MIEADDDDRKTGRKNANGERAWPPLRGQDELIAELATGPWRSTILLCGPRGAGTTFVSRWLAWAITQHREGTIGETVREQLRSATNGPTQQWARRAWLGSEPAVQGWLETRQGTIGIEFARQLRLAARTADVHGGQRVAVVDQGERLTTAGANALLKLTEEAPAGWTTVITARSRRGVLPTLASRCRTLALRPLPMSVWTAAYRDRIPSASPTDSEAVHADTGGNLRTAVTTRGGRDGAAGEAVRRALTDPWGWNRLALREALRSAAREERDEADARERPEDPMAPSAIASSEWARERLRGALAALPAGQAEGEWTPAAAAASRLLRRSGGDVGDATRHVLAALRERTARRPDDRRTGTEGETGERAEPAPQENSD